LRTDSGLLLTDCLQIHLFELPKYVPPSDNRVISDPIEQWLNFFRRAERSTGEELVARLPDPVFAEATGVLETIAKNPDERRLYNERLKLGRNERARKLQALQCCCGTRRTVTLDNTTGSSLNTGGDCTINLGAIK